MHLPPKGPKSSGVSATEDLAPSPEKVSNVPGHAERAAPMVATTERDSVPVVDWGGPVPRLIWSAPSSGTAGSPRRTGGRRHGRSPSASLNGWHRPSPAS